MAPARRPYRCTTCHRRFTGLFALGDHCRDTGHPNPDSAAVAMMHAAAGKPFVCPACAAPFADAEALVQHCAAKDHPMPDSDALGAMFHAQLRALPRDVLRELFEDMAADLSDGAWLAMAEEYGLRIEDLVDDADQGARP